MAYKTNQTGNSWSLSSFVGVYATTGTLTVGWGLPEKRRTPNTMDIYEAYIVDLMAGKIIRHLTVTGRTETDATSRLNLTSEELKKQDEGELEIILHEVGTFERIPVTRTKSV